MKLIGSNDAFKIVIARGFFSRAAGLLFKEKLKSKECLLITPCQSIHTIGMRYNIDVVFIDALGYVTDIHYEVKPFRVINASREACTVVEFFGGTLAQYQLTINKVLFIK